MKFSDDQMSAYLTGYVEGEQAGYTEGFSVGRSISRDMMTRTDLAYATLIVCITVIFCAAMFYVEPHKLW